MIMDNEFMHVVRFTYLILPEVELKQLQKEMSLEAKAKELKSIEMIRELKPV